MSLLRKIIYGLIVCCTSFQVFGSDEFILPECNIQEVVETPITFFLPEAMDEYHSKSEVKSRIKRWLSYGNQVLSNSCIPMVRTLDNIEYVQEIDESWFQDIHTARDLLGYYIGSERISELSEGKAQYYGIVFISADSSFKSEWCGEADVYNNFFIVGLDCDDANLEHELGHLHLAGHDIKTIKKFSGSLVLYSDSFYKKPKKYAHASTCGGRGTIMSYEKDKLPIYSTPEVSYQGEQCGNTINANNAKVLRDFAYSILSAKKAIKLTPSTRQF